MWHFKKGLTKSVDGRLKAIEHYLEGYASCTALVFLCDLELEILRAARSPGPGSDAPSSCILLCVVLCSSVHLTCMKEPLAAT